MSCFDENSRAHIPLGLGVFPQGGADKVDLLPALAPLVRIPLLCAHVDDLEIVSPAGNVFLLVPHRVSLNGPLSRALPVHYAAADVGP